MIAPRPLARNDLVLVTFPFTNLTGSRLRPALIVGRVMSDDLVVAFVTSRVGGADGRWRPEAEHIMSTADPEFAGTGLKVQSVIRLDKLATLDRGLIRRRTGRIGARAAAAVAVCLRYVFEL